MIAPMQTVFSFFAVMDREGRGLEYHMTKVLLFLAVVLYLPGDTFNWQTYAALVLYGVSEMVMAGWFLLLGTVRGLALYVNGYHHRTPLLRAATSLASCLTFGAMAYNVWAEYLAGSLAQPSATMAFYPAFVLAEFRAASRLRWERIYAAH